MLKEEELGAVKITDAFNMLLFRQMDRINVIASSMDGNYNKDIVLAYDSAVKQLKAMLYKSIFNNKILFKIFNDIEAKKKKLIKETKLSMMEFRKAYYDMVYEQFAILMLIYEMYYLVDEVDAEGKLIDEVDVNAGNNTKQNN